jgi:glycosyltransferase involved in cell wall biosynthesis
MVELLRCIDNSRIEPILILLYPFYDSPYKELLPADIKVIVVERRSDSLMEKLRQLTGFIMAVRRMNPQVIVSMITPCNIMAILSNVFSRTRIIISEHITLSELIKTKEAGKMLYFPTSLLVKSLYRFAHKIIAVSEGVKDDLIQQFNISDYKIEVIYNPLDIDRINEMCIETVRHPFLNDRMPIVIAIGRLVRQKRFDILIEALSNVLTEIDARLIILGDGPDRELLERLVEDLGIPDKVSFEGFQINPYKFLSKAAVFVLSSQREGLPMVILEAIACGIPVVSTDCPSGPREILENGRCGLLVPVNDVNAIANGIKKLLNDKNLRKEFSTLGRERAKYFSIDKIVKQYENVICESINQKV